MLHEERRRAKPRAFDNETSQPIFDDFGELRRTNTTRKRAS
jgi:hypothetical protein